MMLEKHGRNIFEVTTLEHGGKKLERICRINPWIKCSNELPPDCQEVLVAIGDTKLGTPALCVCYLLYDREFKPITWILCDADEYDQYFKLDSVNYWCELPEPPEKI